MTWEVDRLINLKIKPFIYGLDTSSLTFPGCLVNVSGMLINSGCMMKPAKVVTFAGIYWGNKLISFYSSIWSLYVRGTGHLWS